MHTFVQLYISNISKTKYPKNILKLTEYYFFKLYLFACDTENSDKAVRNLGHDPGNLILGCVVPDRRLAGEVKTTSVDYNTLH